MQIHDVAITPDCARMLCVGSLVASEEGLQPDKSRSEKQIVVYNLCTRRSESRAPVLRDARNISLTKAGTMALVSYDDMAPPQLWEMQYLISHSPTRIRRLILCHTYVPKGAVDFAGPSSFGGNEDPLVIAVGKSMSMIFSQSCFPP